MKYPSNISWFFAFLIFLFTAHSSLFTIYCSQLTDHNSLITDPYTSRLDPKLCPFSNRANFETLYLISLRFSDESGCRRNCRKATLERFHIPCVIVVRTNAHIHRSAV